MTTRFFHWRATASVARLYNTFKSRILARNHHDIFDRRLCLVSVFQVWMKAMPKSTFGFGAFSPRLWNALPQALRESECSSVFLQETEDSLVLKPVTAPSSIALSLSLCVFCAVCHVAKRLPRYAPLAWLFHECLSAPQIDNHHHHHSKSCN